MKLKPSLILPLSALIILLAGSCRKEEQPYSGLFSHSFLYYGSAYNNLDTYISENVREMARGTLPSISEDKAVFAFIHTTDSHGDYTTPGKAVLLRLYTKNGANTIDTVKVYQQPVVSSEPEMIRRVLLDADEICKARTHGFLFSSHATGFLPKGYSKKSERAVTLGFSEDVPAIPGTVPFYENDPAYPLTKSIGAQYIGLQSIVHRNGNEQHEGYCYTQSQGSLHILGYSQVRAHTQEKCEYHVVHKDGADKQTYHMFHYSLFYFGMLLLFFLVQRTVCPYEATYDDE